MLSDKEEESTFFLEALDLFYDSQWLYKFPVTEILAKTLLDEFPPGWLTLLEKLSNEELNELVVNRITKRDWPETLLSFVEKCTRLDKLPRILDCNVEILPKSFRTGLTNKKQHEILRLANLVHSQCAKDGIDTIVDLGSGLGYVCQLLNFLYNYRVLGLESNTKNVETAKRRQKDLYPSSLPRVRYICSKIDLDSSNEIENYLRDSFDDKNREFCLIGLHACADLGIDACKLFGKISTAKILVLLSCCYHKLDICDATSDERYFRNFPVSRCLRNILDTSARNYREILRRPFLRLACQESADRWNEMDEETHRKHSFHVLARAALEFYAQKHSIVLKKRVQKATRKTQCANFETYLDDVFLRYEFQRDEKLLEPSEIRDEILSTWEENSGKLASAEIYTGLQLMLQSSAESLVLEDRRYWLEEMNFESEIVGVTSRNLSPRSHAIVSKKKEKRNKSNR